MRVKSALSGTLVVVVLALTVPAAVATPSVGLQATVLSRTTVSTLTAASQPGVSFGRGRGHEARPITGFPQPTAPQLALLTLPVDVVLLTITFQPGASSGWHSHPGIVLVKVTSGTLTLYDPACGSIERTAGETFAEPAVSGLARNEGSVPATIQITAFLTVGAPFRIDDPQPANCPTR